MEDIVCRKCGTINEYRVERKANNDVATCTACGSFIKNIPYSPPALYFGQFKGKPIEQYETKRELDYLYWIRNHKEIWPKLNARTQEAINLRLDGNR